MTFPLPEHIVTELLEAAGPACWEALLKSGQSNIRQDVLSTLLEPLQDEELFALPGHNLLRFKYGTAGSGVNSAVRKAAVYGDITILDMLLRLALSRIADGRGRVLMSWCMDSALVSAAELGDIEVVRILQKHGGKLGAHVWTLLIQTGKADCLNFALSSIDCAPGVSWKSALLRCMEQGKDQECVRIYNVGRRFLDPAAVVIAGSWYGRNLIELPAALGCVELSALERRLLCGSHLLSDVQWFTRDPPWPGRKMVQGYASTAQVLKYVIVNFKTVPENSPPLEEVLLDLQMEGDAEGMDAVAALWDRDE